MARNKTSIAKITRPALSGIFPRKRLFKLLDSCRKKPVTWVSGPAGSGKTTLVASYLDSRKLPCLWYHVDEGDSDIASFFYYLGLAATKSDQRRKIPLPLLTPEYLGGLPVFTRRYFENLAAHVKVPFTLVFDNYQEVHVASSFHEIVSLGLSALPDGVSAIILSRCDPPPEFARLRADGRVNVLGWHDIRFTPKESKGIVCLKKKRCPSDEVFMQLYQKTQGWAAGLVLMSEGLQTNATGNPIFPAADTPQEIFHYFAGEILDKLDSETRDFLLLASFLSKMTAKTAEKITDQDNAGEILSQLTSENFFTEKHSLSEPVYKFHPLFREFLQERIKESLNHEGVVRLQKQAAELLIESGQIEDAVSLLAEAADWNGLIPLVLDNAQTLVMQGRSRTLREWLGRIPKDIAAKSPWLLYWLGVSAQPFDPIESRPYFEQAFDLFENQEDQTGVLLAWAGVVDTFLYAWGDFKPIDRWIDWLDESVRHDHLFPSPEIETQVTSGMTGALIWRRPNHPDIKNWLNRALSLAHKSRNMSLRLHAYFNAALYYVSTGEFASGSLVVEETRSIAESESAAPLVVLSFKTMELILYTMLGEAERPFQIVAQGLKLAQDSGVHVMDPMLLAGGVYAALNANDHLQAEELLGKMDTAVKNTHSSPALYWFLRGYLNLINGNASRAVVIAEKAATLAEETGTPGPEVLSRLLLAEAAYEAGNSDSAAMHLSQARDINRGKIDSSILEYVTLVIEAYFAFRQDKEKTGLEVLRRAMALGRQRGYTTKMFIWRPAVYSLLCSRALGAGIEVEYARDLVRKFSLLPDDRSMENEVWPWPVKIRTLGRFELLVGDDPVTFTAKAQKKPLELLKAVISLGGKDVPEDQLTEILWPDSDGDAAHSVFTTTLARLRPLLGSEKAIHVHDKNVTLDNRYCWVDAWAFEKHARDAEQKLRNADLGVRSEKRTDQTTIVSDLLEKVTTLYRGPFLPSDAGNFWNVSTRERLRNKFLMLIKGAGDFHEQARQWEHALAYYQKAMDIDGLSEEITQRLITCHLELGRYADAVAAYLRCKQTLLKAFGIAPSDKSEALYQAALRKR